MEDWQRRLVGEIPAQVDDYRAGQITTRRLLTNTWGLMTAAGLEGSEDFMGFYEHWTVIDGEDELRTEPWARREWASDDRLDAEVSALRSWAEEVGLPRSS